MEEIPQNQEDTQTEITDASVKKIKGQPKVPPLADRAPGKSLLPTARVQRIMKADKELSTCNREAVFLISVATEEFVKRLGRAAQQQAVREKRSTVQRKDLGRRCSKSLGIKIETKRNLQATAARRGEEFAFLEELLSINVPVAPPAPATKRKPKTNANPGTNIKDVLSKVASNEQNTEGNSGSISGFQRGAQLENTHDSGSQDVEQEDSMSTS